MVSGGADSTALLVMACTSRLDVADGRGRARIARERLHVLHVNHHLRGAASDGDEAFVRELCERYGLPLCVEHVSFEGISGQNLEAAAREARYRAARPAMWASCAAPRACAARRRGILTAHTASDRAENVLHERHQGVGSAGAFQHPAPPQTSSSDRCSTARTTSSAATWRSRGIPWREDASNQDTSYLRNFVRHRVVPLAASRNPHVVRALSSTCDILGDEDALLGRLAATALRSCIRRQQDGLVVLDARRLAAADIALARRMVRLAVGQLDPEARLEMRHVEAVLACVAAGEGSVTLPGGIDARMEFGALALRTPAAHEELAAGWLTVPGRMALANEAVLEARLERIPAGCDPVGAGARAHTRRRGGGAPCRRPRCGGAGLCRARPRPPRRGGARVSRRRRARPACGWTPLRPAT